MFWNFYLGKVNYNQRLDRKGLEEKKNNLVATCVIVLMFVNKGILVKFFNNQLTFFVLASHTIDIRKTE